MVAAAVCVCPSCSSCALQLCLTNLFKYVEKFVLCPGCRLPETIYKVKSEMIYSVCAACGAKELLDMTHKLTVFILAQDKKRKKEKKDAEKKDEKDAKKKGDKKKKVGGASNNLFCECLLILEAIFLFQEWFVNCARAHVLFRLKRTRRTRRKPRLRRRKSKRRRKRRRRRRYLREPA
jgi:hypothetical protein